jgi:hypothetical protein
MTRMRRLCQRSLKDDVATVASHRLQTWHGSNVSDICRYVPKMPVPAVVKRLRQVNAFGVVASRERLLHCSDNPGAWDYTCVFHGDPINSATWVQFGVLVDKAHIIEMSETYPAGTPVPPPLTLASR